MTLHWSHGHLDNVLDLFHDITRGSHIAAITCFLLSVVTVQLAVKVQIMLEYFNKTLKL